MHVKRDLLLKKGRWAKVAGVVGRIVKDEVFASEAGVDSGGSGR